MLQLQKTSLKQLLLQLWQLAAFAMRKKTNERCVGDRSRPKHAARFALVQCAIAELRATETVVDLPDGASLCLGTRIHGDTCELYAKLLQVEGGNTRMRTAARNRHEHGLHRPKSSTSQEVWLGRHELQLLFRFRSQRRHNACSWQHGHEREY